MDEKIFNREIVRLCKRLSAIKNSWAVTGGANHFLRKIVTGINDIDIITSKEGGAEIGLCRCFLAKTPPGSAP